MWHSFIHTKTIGLITSPGAATRAPSAVDAAPSAVDLAPSAAAEDSQASGVFNGWAQPIRRARRPAAWRASGAGATTAATGLNCAKSRSRAWRNSTKQANDVAVEQFVAGRIGFTRIAETVAAALEAHRPCPDPTLEDVLEAERWARAYAGERLRQAGTPTGR